MISCWCDNKGFANKGSSTGNKGCASMCKRFWPGTSLLFHSHATTVMLRPMLGPGNTWFHAAQRFSLQVKKTCWACPPHRRQDGYLSHLCETRVRYLDAFHEINWLSIMYERNCRIFFAPLRVSFMPGLYTPATRSI